MSCSEKYSEGGLIDKPQWGFRSRGNWDVSESENRFEWFYFSRFHIYIAIQPSVSYEQGLAVSEILWSCS